MPRLPDLSFTFDDNVSPPRQRVMLRGWTRERLYSDRFAYDATHGRYLYRDGRTLWVIEPPHVQEIGRRTQERMLRSAYAHTQANARDPMNIQFAQQFRREVVQDIAMGRLAVISERMTGVIWGEIRRYCRDGRDVNSLLEEARPSRDEGPVQPDILPPGVTEWQQPTDVAQMTAVGRGSCVDRQESIQCPPSCPCRQS